MGILVLRQWCVRVEWQKVDGSISLTNDGEAKSPIAGSFVQEMSLQNGKIVPDDGETGVTSEEGGDFVEWR